MNDHIFDELRLSLARGRQGGPAQSVSARTRRRRRTQRRTQWAKAVAAAATTHVKLAGEAANAMVAAAPSEQPKGGARAKRPDEPDAVRHPGSRAASWRMLRLDEMHRAVPSAGRQQMRLLPLPVISIYLSIYRCAVLRNILFYSALTCEACCSSLEISAEDDMSGESESCFDGGR